ncbi:hypothetical protein [Streptomyces sp. IBSNAI001]
MSVEAQRWIAGGDLGGELCGSLITLVPVGGDFELSDGAGIGGG